MSKLFREDGTEADMLDFVEWGVPRALMCVEEFGSNWWKHPMRRILWLEFGTIETLRRAGLDTIERLSKARDEEVDSDDTREARERARFFVKHGKTMTEVEDELRESARAEIEEWSEKLKESNPIMANRLRQLLEVGHGRRER